MTPLPVITSANQLIQQDITFVQSWLERLRRGQINVPDGFNWLGLAEIAATRAYQTLDNGDEAMALKWAEISASVYEQLAQDEIAAEGFLDSAMRLRAGMIQKLGTRRSHPILDVSLLMSWALDKMSEETLQQDVDQWLEHQHDRDYVLNHLDQIRRLRKLKVKLNTLAIALEATKPDEPVQRWLDLARKLP